MQCPECQSPTDRIETSECGRHTGCADCLHEIAQQEVEAAYWLATDEAVAQRRAEAQWAAADLQAI